MVKRNNWALTHRVAFKIKQKQLMTTLLPLNDTIVSCLTFVCYICTHNLHKYFNIIKKQTYKLKITNTEIPINLLTLNLTL